MRRRWSLPLIAALAVLSTPAFAEGGDPTAAASLFHEGREAAKRGDFPTACAKLDQSYRLDAAVGTLLNLADCQDHLGKTATAWQLFQQALQHLSKGDDRIEPAKKRVAALESKIARLEIVLAPGAPPGTRITRDGNEVSSLGTALPIDPGPHEVVATAPGRDERRVSITMNPGQTSRVEIAPGTATAAAPAPAAPTGMSRVRLAGIIVGSAGVVGLGTAIATGLMLPAQQKIVAAHCGPPAHAANLCDATGYQAAQTGKGLAGLNTAAWALGGAAAATGVVLIIVGRNKPAAVEVTASASAAGASLQGTF